MIELKKEFSYVAGTGGIGMGILFKLLGSHLLGKNESRLAELTDYTDYCKLHIILNYVAAYLKNRIPVYAIGRVGADKIGQDLISLMKKSGIQKQFVTVDPDPHQKTLYAVCFQYPDGEGGNLTAANSASSTVSPEDIRHFFATSGVTGTGIILAAPEVPIDARITLLQEGRKRNCLNIASILSGEVAAFEEKGGFELTDILSINQDEAEAISVFSGFSENGDSFPAYYRYLKEKNPSLLVIATCGKDGSNTYWQGRSMHTASVPAEVINSAGSGDCFLGTIIAGVANGIPLLPSEECKDVCCSAQDLASAAAAMKLGCHDTIHFSINTDTLWEFTQEKGIQFSEQISRDFFGK